jgi:hypothetical protein
MRPIQIFKSKFHLDNKSCGISHSATLFQACDGGKHQWLHWGV